MSTTYQKIRDKTTKLIASVSDNDIGSLMMAMQNAVCERAMSVSKVDKILGKRWQKVSYGLGQLSINA